MWGEKREPIFIPLICNNFENNDNKMVPMAPIFIKLIAKRLVDCTEPVAIHYCKKKKKHFNKVKEICETVFSLELCLTLYGLINKSMF